MDISIQGIAVHKQSILRESAKRSFIKVVKKLIIKRKTVLKITNNNFHANMYLRFRCFNSNKQVL